MQETAKQLPRQYEETERIAQQGKFGAWRQDFCRKYAYALTRMQEHVHQSLVEALALRGERITCLKGCTYCCFHYVTVSLAHGILIVDFLYKNRELLSCFADSYERWQRKGYSIAERIDQIRNQALSSSLPIDRVLAETRPLSERYLDANIPCPFLVDRGCTIYEVRPMSCSGHYSASPPDWCAPASRYKPVIHHMVPGDNDLMELMRLIDPRLILYELTLPIMIHKLLTEGAPPVISEILQSHPTKG